MERYRPGSAATAPPPLPQHGAIVQGELYFLIAKFLSQGPLQNAANVIIAELEQQRILPQRVDWTGHEHSQSFEELERKYAHISPCHLLEICSRIPAILELDTQPSVPGIVSLLGAGRQSLLRTPTTIVRPKSLRDHCTRLHAMPLPETAQRRANNNIVHVLLGRQMSGPLIRRHAVPTGFYEKMLLLRRTLGHLSAVYCVLFDRSGKYIITGADDLLVKLWSAIDGRLLTTFRGASAEITDIAVNLDNTLLAAGSLDRILRVWDLQTAGPIAVLSGHTGMITSVNFCPSPRNELKYLVTTSTDGSVAFWQYGTPRGGKATFAPKPIQYHEKLRPGQAQMICASFSPGGVFLAAGSADHHVRVYLMAEEGPKRILETEAHSDTVDSIQWAHSGLRFVSGSKDGMAHVWNFEAQQWRPLKLNMSDRLASCPVPEDESRKLKVTMVSWDYSDRWVITAVNDFTIKVWNASTGKLHRVMRGHTDELYVLESHPKDPHVLISAGHDGQLFVWNILDGVAITSFVNNIDGQGHGGVFDAKWSPDGSMIAATDSHGHILMYGFGSGHQRLKMLPKELFFHTDYRPLMRDVNHFVMDEQTQTIPHLMPPPFLVDVDGNPHPPAFQRLVPGREACTTEQLVPNITMGPEGMEVVDSANNTVSNIDRLIAVLANRQGPAAAQAAAAAAAAQVNGGGGDAEAAEHEQMAAPAAGGPPGAAALQRQQFQPPAPPPGVAQSPRSVHSGHNVRVEGVRQSSGNWEREQNFKWIRRTYVRPMQYSRLQALRQSTYVAGQQEQEVYKREMRRRPMMINTGNASSGGQTLRPTKPKRRPVRQSRAAAAAAGSAGSAGPSGSAAGAAAGGPTPAYRTRAAREREHPPSDDNSDDPDHIASASSAADDSNDSTAQEDMMSGMSSSSGDSDSSDYSDWVANDQPGQALEPPKRSKRKPVRARQFSPSSSPDGRAADVAPEAEGGVNAGASTSRGTGTRATTNGAATAHTSRRRATNGGGGAGGRLGGHRRAPQRIQPIFENGEIPERYRPPEWLSEVIPRKAPYYPQMGDDVVYFRQGHERYLDAVRTKNVYKMPNNCEPWHQIDLRDYEPVKVIGIKYEIRPPRLCCLKLALLNADGSLTGQSFTIKYHDMPDVLDFIVLWQTYETAVRRLWTPGDRFRCMIDDSWWTGGIESRTALSAEFPTSLFMCFRTRWDNGEFEAMSPWDMEPIDQNRLPEEVGGQVAVTAEELRATLYQPKSEEWPRGDRDATCRRIVAGLDEVMGLAIADPFLVPVDLNSYPSYAFMVEYPIDLTTIKARFENHFYRRLTSAQFDVRYLATNAEKFNQSSSQIVKHARIITDLCLRIIKDQNEVDVGAVYHQLMDTYVTSDSDADTEVGGRASTSAAAAAATAVASTSAASRRSTRTRPNEDWQTKCRDLLEMIWARDDSTPFREPVDLIEHPDYLSSVDTPMDLRTVKEDLLGGNYNAINEFVNDMRLIFSNSRNYNTNKRSRIYSMTLRLSSLFEAQLKAFTGKSGKKRVATRPSQPSSSGGIASNARRRRAATSQAAGPSNGHAGPSGSGAHATVNYHPSHSRIRIQPARDSDDSDDDEDEFDILSPEHRRSAGGSSTASTNNASATDAQPGPSTARVSSRRRLDVADAVPASSAMRNGGASGSGAVGQTQTRTVAASRRTQQPQAVQQQQQRGRRHAVNDDDDDEEDDEEAEEEEEDDDSDSSAASSSASSDDVSSAGHRKRRKRHTRIASDGSHSANDSEESYNPIARKRAKEPKRRVVTNSGHNAAVAGGSGEPRTVVNGRGTGAVGSTANVANLPSTSRRKPHASAATTAATSGSDDEAADDDEEEEEDEDEEEDEEEQDDANDEDYNVSSTPKKTVRSSAQKRKSTAKKSTSGVPDPLASSGSDDNGRRRSARKPVQQRYESDHSYHLNASTSTSGSHKRRIQLDSDPETAAEGVPHTTGDMTVEEVSQDSDRPRRNNQRRVRRFGDAEETVDETSTSTAVLASGSSAAAGAVVRPVRSTRSARSQAEDDESEDDQVLSQLSNGYRSRAAVGGATRNGHDTRPAPSAAAASFTRIRSSSAVAVPQSSAAPPTVSQPETSRRQHRSQVQEDHNYGEPGPSSMRHSRRVPVPALSRHQRNADELDNPQQQQQHIDEPALVSGRLRRRPTPPQGHSSSSQEATSATVGAHHHRTRATASQEKADEETDDDDDDDDDDDKPLRFMASSQSSNSTSTRPRRTATDSQHSDDVLASTSRSTRTQKRPYYNEDSDDEQQQAAATRTNQQQPPNKRVATTRNNTHTTTQHRDDEDETDGDDDDDDDDGAPLVRRGASQEERSHDDDWNSAGNVPDGGDHDNHDDDGEENDDDGEPSFSVSSRGRVRRITAKARGMFRE